VRPPAPVPRLDPDFDARLVERCLGGDGRAWETLVQRYERLVYAVARSYRLSDEDAADAFQEVFGALVRGLPRMRDSRTLCRWLSSTSERIARATALRRRRELALTAPEAEAPPAAGPPVESSLERLEEQALVRLAMAELPGRCRELLQALYYEDPPASYIELARRLGTPVGSLGPTRARCFERLRRILESLRAGGSGITAPSQATFPSERAEPGPGVRRSIGVSPLAERSA
jgi:RNA polymerase sigma factor (sigma-70 family)